MDPQRFDALARSLAGPKTRRGFLGGIAALGAGLLGAHGGAAQVSQAQCGNTSCRANPGKCNAGCVCCVYANGSSRCTPPDGCSGTVAGPVATTTAAPTPTTAAPTTTAAPPTTTAPTTTAPTTTAPTTTAPTTTAAPATTTLAPTTAAPTTTTTTTTPATTTIAPTTTTTTEAPTTSTSTTTSTTTAAPTCPAGQILVEGVCRTTCGAISCNASSQFCCDSVICCTNGQRCNNGGCNNGGGGGCFVAGTPIAMADGTSKPIERVVAGDDVLGRGGQATRVLGVLLPVLGDRPLYAFNGGPAFVTASHPFLTEEGWKAVDPDAARAEVPGLDIGRLAAGDVLVAAGRGTGERPVPLRSLEGRPADPATQLYNLDVGGTDTYVAGGWIVHNKILS